MKQSQEDFRLMRNSHDKLDGQNKLSQEQLALVENSLHSFSNQKSLEIDLLTKEI